MHLDLCFDTGSVPDERDDVQIESSKALWDAKRMMPMLKLNLMQMVHLT
jgi:hypothetical protein